MSKTCCVSYGDRAFWAYDVSVAVLLYLAANRAEAEYPDDFDADLIEQWRVVTFLGSNVGVQLDDSRLDDRGQVRFPALMADCVEDLRGRGQISEREASTWQALGHRIIWRSGPETISTAPIIELAEAMVALIGGELPEPPEGHWWAIGFHGGRDVIKMHRR